MWKLDSGHEVSYPTEEDQARVKKNFEAYREGVVQLMPGRWFYPKSFLQYANAFYNYKFRPTDVVIMTYPKCGTSWLQEIVWTMRNDPNLDQSDAKPDVNFRSPFLEFDFIFDCGTEKGQNKEVSEMFSKMCPGKDSKDGIFLQLSHAIPGLRTLKTHLAFSLLPPNMLDVCKVIYLARNPKDVAVSYHHHSRLLKFHQYVGTFDDFIQFFIDDEQMYSPYWTHMQEAWSKRPHPNLHCMFYEDLKNNTKEELKRLNVFLDTELTEKQIENVVHYTSFEATKKRKDESQVGVSREDMECTINVNVMEEDGGLLRKGQVGSYKEKLSPDLEAKIDEWTKKNIDEFKDEFNVPW